MTNPDQGKNPNQDDGKTSDRNGDGKRDQSQKPQDERRTGQNEPKRS